MATKDAIQRRELAARQAMDRAMTAIARHAGVELAVETAEYSPDPYYRHMREIEVMAEAMTRLAEAITGQPVEQPAGPAALVTSQVVEEPEAVGDQEAETESIEAEPVAKDKGKRRRP